jgi:hypothetical protein
MWMSERRLTERNKKLFFSSASFIRGVVKGQESIIMVARTTGELFACPVPDCPFRLPVARLRDATKEQQRVFDNIKWVDSRLRRSSGDQKDAAPTGWLLWGKITDQNRLLISSLIVASIRGVVGGQEALVSGGSDIFGFRYYYMKAEDVPDDMAFLTSSAVADATEEQQRILDETEWLEEDPKQEMR